MMPSKTEDPLALHPTLPTYYRADADRQTFVNDLFDRGSSHYDWIDGVFSFGSGDRYRAEVLRNAGLAPGMSVCDVACGTGKVTATARAIVGPGGRVIGVDPSRGMLDVASSKIDARFVQAVGGALALKSDSFDLLSMGYALRHVGDMRAAFREYHRVLKPGGRALIMEIAVPKSRFLAKLLSVYMNNVIPFLVRLFTRSRDAEKMMKYYWDTTAACVPPETILDALREAGFRNVRRTILFGLFTEYHGTK